MLERLTLTNVGPAESLDLELGPRLNVVTGDNGLGKTFLLDCAWYALTSQWAGMHALPLRRDSDATIGAAWTSSAGTVRASNRHFLRRVDRWQPFESLRTPDLSRWLAIYLTVDDTFIRFDPALRDNQRDLSVAQLSSAQVFDGDGGNGHKPYCNGLIEDWTVWRYQDVERFKALVAAMAALSPDASERLEPGNESVRVTLDDVRKIPTLRFPWGEVPITLLSAGMRRILSLAYVLVWTWHEHLQAVKLTGHPVAERMIVLIDEVESHLHPRWQRRILPAVVNTISGLADQLDVQVICSSHSPMVLASMEPTFDPARDRLFHLDASGNGTGASVRQVPFAKFGDAVGWLTSPVFGLEQARSAEAEEAIEAAEAFMRNDLAALPDGLRTKDEIHAELQRVLGELDEFWLRWVVTAPPVRKP